MTNQPCPICSGPDHHHFLHIKDHSVSGKDFELVTCTSCHFTFTRNPPPPEEIGQYYQSDAYISHTDGKETFLDRMYQLIRSFTLKQKQKLLIRTTDLDKGKMLDYGCGTGAFLKQMQSGGWQIEGVEPDAGARAKATLLTGIEIKDTTTLNNFANRGFNVITLWHVLEHVHDLHRVLDQFRQALANNGFLFIAVPNHHSFDAKHYGSYWAAYDVPRHLHHFTPDSMEKLMQQHGFKRVAMKPMWFDAFYVSLLSEKYKKDGAGLLSAVLIGFLSNLKAMLKPGTCSSQLYIYQKKV